MEQIDLEKLLKANQEKIYRICRIYAVPPVEPQDLFQEVAYQIWKSLSSFKENANIDSWVYRIALNVCMRAKLNLERKSNRTVRFDSIEFRTGEANSSASDNEKYRFLKECIATLNESDTSIVVLFLEDLPYKQIAEITGLTENHVAVKMKRIRKKLFDCIAPKLN